MGLRRGQALVVAAVVVWTTAAVIQLWIGPALGHDEACYVTDAQRWWAGEPALFNYRSVGTELLAMPAVAFGWDEVGLRALAAVLGLLVPLGAFALARASFDDRRIAPWTAAVLAGAHPMIVQNAQLLGDLPAAGLVLLGLAIVVRELSRGGGPTWRLAGAAPLFAAAFYVRYGSVTVLAVMAVAAIAIYGRAILSRPLPIVALVVVGAGLLAPHVLHSVRETGSVLGLINEGAQATRLAYLGEGLVTYVTVNPFHYYGFATVPLVLAGLVMALTRSRPARFLGLVAVGQVVALGIRSHAEPRYMFISVALLVILGVAAAVRGFDRLRGQARTAALVAALAAVIACWGIALVKARRVALSRRASLAGLADLGARIAADAGGRPCTVILRTGPQVAYYSGCESYYLSAERPLPSHRRAYVVSVPTYSIDPAAVAAELGTKVGTLGDSVVVIETR
jgi:hypothetical protein